MDRFIIISGCSGGGKSALLSELHRRGYSVIEEPGRRIVAEELKKSRDQALPWTNPKAFAERAIQLSLQDRNRAKEMPGAVFFDRGLIDAASALESVTGKPVLPTYRAERYNSRVFLTPPWSEIYVTDAERQHSLQDAIQEYERLIDAFTSLNYSIEILPKTGVAQRVDLILQSLQLSI
ncbi:MAG: AAA family ATPase [Bacteroidetes bacterium]|nr:AAA family ATPase [Bacteroidota bacterium]